MAAAQSEKKKAPPQKKMKQPLCVKTATKKIHPKQKKKLQMKQGKQVQKKMGGRQANKVKAPGQSSKMSQQAHQRKATLPTKGNGRAASFGKSASNPVSSPAKWDKLGRNICSFSCKDLQYEVNELMRKELTSRMFANKPRVSH